MARPWASITVQICSGSLAPTISLIRLLAHWNEGHQNFGGLLKKGLTPIGMVVSYVLGLSGFAMIRCGGWRCFQHWDMGTDFISLILKSSGSLLDNWYIESSDNHQGMYIQNSATAVSKSLSHTGGWLFSIESVFKPMTHQRVFMCWWALQVFSR